MIEVICAGLGKTGTTSLAKALRILGQTVSDFRDMMEEAELPFWTSLLFSSDERDSARTRLGEFYGASSPITAVADELAAYHWADLLSAFPNSKVILTVRDSNAWMKSKEAHMKQFIEWERDITSKLRARGDENGVRAIEAAARVAHEIERRIYGDVEFDRDSFVAAFERHNARVIREVPADKLLVLRLTEQPEWDALCRFLDKAPPGVPFPAENVGHADLSAR